MQQNPFFSICIPVFKNVVHLQRLLDSIYIQTFTDFEVVITDDSPDETIGIWLNTNYLHKRVRYFRNKAPLGTPENWNEAIRKANGTWIKLMHDDDWFATEDALNRFYQSTLNTKANFIFSGYRNIFLHDGGRVQEMPFSTKRWKRILDYPPIIYARNIIGAPSTVLVKRDIGELYDNRFKWLVDIDYYIRLMSKSETLYIALPLINVGQSNSQVTLYTHNKPEVEIPEGLLLQSKLGPESFHHLLYFDVWWRLIRNLGIRDQATFISYASVFSVPSSIYSILNFQRFFPKWALKIGFISKLLMTICWALTTKIKSRKNKHY
jgi:glycosyltransferase involved in cell wall biosynthesis